MIVLEDRQTLSQDIDAAHTAGARLHLACEIAGIDLRTLQRWKAHEGLPELGIVVLARLGCVMQDVLVHQLRPKARFPDSANQRGRGFFAQQCFGRATGSHAQKEGQQRTVVVPIPGRFAPCGGGVAVEVVDRAQSVFEPEIGVVQNRVILFRVAIG